MPRSSSRRPIACRNLVSDVVETAVIFVPGEEEHDLNQVVRGAMSLIRAEVEAKEVSVLLELAKDLPSLTMDVGNMKRAILQIAANALEAMPSGGTLELKTSAKDNWVELQINDNGKGIPPAFCPGYSRLFSPPSRPAPAWACPSFTKSLPSTGAKLPLKARKMSALR